MKHTQEKKTQGSAVGFREPPAPVLKDAPRYKDTVFRMLFREKERLLELYNAMSGKSYDNPELLEVVTLDNAIYMGMKDDLAYVIDCGLYLCEHQSTVNPNMPLRLLQYVTEEYGKLTAGKNYFGRKLIKLPTPHFVVFYNGAEKQPERMVLKLSDAFLVPEEEPELELKVLFLNINEGYNEDIKEQCRSLREYMQYVDRVRGYEAVMPLEEAVARAIEECIREDILREFLLKNKAEVVKMSLYEFDEAAFVKDIRETAYEDGVMEGEIRGRAEGRARGKAEDILELLQDKEPLSEEFKNRILEQSDISVLSRWLKAAVKAESLEEWTRLIKG